MVAVIVQVAVSKVVIVVVVIILRFMGILGVVGGRDRRLVSGIAAGRSRAMLDLIGLVVPVILLVIRVLIIGLVILVEARTSCRGGWAIVRVVPDQVNDIAYN